MFQSRCSICDRKFIVYESDADICPRCRGEVNRNKTASKRITAEEQTEANEAWAHSAIQHIDTTLADYYTRKDK